MNRYVGDTSVIVKCFVDEQDSEKAKQVLANAIQGKIDLLAPSLLSYELTNGLVVNGLSSAEIQPALSLFFRLIGQQAITIFPPSELLLLKATQIAELDTEGQGYISSYDAVFHALALEEQALLLTADKKHYNKTKDKVGSIVLLSDFDLS